MGGGVRIVALYTCPAASNFRYQLIFFLKFFICGVCVCVCVCVCVYVCVCVCVCVCVVRYYLFVSVFVLHSMHNCTIRCKSVPSAYILMKFPGTALDETKYVLFLARMSFLLHTSVQEQPPSPPTHPTSPIHWHANTHIMY